MRRFGREPISGLTHLAGAILALGGLAWLVYQTQDTPDKLISVVIYGFSMILLYGASAALHLVYGPQRVILWLRRLDHAAVYMLIAGTYTPLVYTTLQGGWRWGILGAVWVMAVAGAIFKLTKLSHHTRASTLSYILMGWLGVLTAPQAVDVLPLSVALLILGGGLFYTVGALIFTMQKPNFHPQFGFHEIWHLFVMGGSSLHYAAVVLVVM